MTRAKEEQHWEAVRHWHGKQAKLPFEKKLEIVEELLADYEIIRKSVTAFRKEE